MNAGNGNPKSEIREPKEVRSPKSELASARADWTLGLESSLDYGLRITDFTVWQLADSAFPTGGFAHSSGLEAAWQHGEVRHREDLLSFVEASLRQVERAALPFVMAAFDAPQRLEAFDRLCDAFTSNHVASRASRVQGRAFRAAAQRITARTLPDPPFGHFAPGFGAVVGSFGVARDTAARLFVFMHLRGVLAAAVRLNIVGPMEAQALQFALGPRAEAIAESGACLSLDDLAQTAPLLDLWQGAQDRLYSRLFQS